MKKIYLWLLLLILLAGGILRFYQLDAESLWTDEAVSLMEAGEESPAKVMAKVAQLEGSPYGHHLLLHYWIKLFGDSEFSLRFTSAFFGLLSILVFFFLVKGLDPFFDRPTALLSSLLMATAMLQVLYSQEARLYSLFGFLALLSTYFLVEAMRNKKIDDKISDNYDNNNNNSQRNRKFLIAYILTLVLAMYVNYLTLFLVFLHWLLICFLNRKPFLKEWACSVWVFFLLSLPLARLLLRQFFTRHHHLLNALTVRGVPEALASLGLFFFILPLALVIGFLALILFLKKKTDFFSGAWFTWFKEKKEMLFLAGLAALGIVYLFSLKFTVESLSLVRHSYFIVPVLYVLMAKGILQLKSRKLKVLVVVIILVVNGFALHTYYESSTKPDWKGAIAYLAEKAPAGSMVIIDDSPSTLFLFNYYAGHDAGGPGPEYNLIAVKSGEEVDKEVDRFLPLDASKNMPPDAPKNIWLLVTPQFKDYQGVKEKLEARFPPGELKEFNKILLFKYSSG